MTTPHGPRSPAPAPLPVAYCAPGRKGWTAFLLDLLGEDYSEVVEHSWMAGRTDIILAADLTSLFDGPVLFPEVTPHPPGTDWNPCNEPGRSVIITGTTHIITGTTQ